MAADSKAAANSSFAAFSASATAVSENEDALLFIWECCDLVMHEVFCCAVIPYALKKGRTHLYEYD